MISGTMRVPNRHRGFLELLLPGLGFPSFERDQTISIPCSCCLARNHACGLLLLSVKICAALSIWRLSSHRLLAPCASIGAHIAFLHIGASLEVGVL